jgi:copper oxidase (laccase) domain-containing protein
MEFKSYNFGENILNVIDVSPKQINYYLKYSKNAIVNQKKFFKELNLDNLFENRVMVASPFSGKVKRIHGESYSGYTSTSSNCQEYDGIITSDKNLPLYFGFGDCPWLMVSSENSIGVVHSSRGTLDKNILQTFFKEFSKTSDLSKIKIGFSPYIFKGNFGNEYLPEERKEFFAKFSKIKNGLYYIDLKKAIVNDLINIGIKKKNIFDFKINTYEMSKKSSKLGGFEISHRQAKNKEGRGGAILMIKKNRRE